MSLEQLERDFEQAKAAVDATHSVNGDEAQRAIERAEREIETIRRTLRESEQRIEEAFRVLRRAGYLR